MPGRSSGLVGSGRSKRLSLADAAQPSRLASATLPGVDGAAQFRLSGRGRDDTGVAVFQAVVSDLFESVLSQIDALPMPRQRRQALAAST